MLSHTWFQAVPELSEQAQEPSITPIQVHPFCDAEAHDDTVTILPPPPFAALVPLRIRTVDVGNAFANLWCTQQGEMTRLCLANILHHLHLPSITAALAY